MNVLGVKEEGHGNFLFRVKFRLSCMITCPECNQCFAEIDGSCALCRSLRRLATEARAVARALRGWVVDQTRVWVSLLQEESLKWEVAQAEARRREEARQAAAAATSKAVSPVVATSSAAEGPAGEGEHPVKTEPAEESKRGECIISPGTISSLPEGDQTEPQEEEVAVPASVEEKGTSSAKKKKKDKKKKTKEETCHEREKSASEEKAHIKKDKATKRKRKVHQGRERGGGVQRIGGALLRGQGEDLWLEGVESLQNLLTHRQSGTGEPRLLDITLLETGSTGTIQLKAGIILLGTGSTLRNLHRGGDRIKGLQKERSKLSGGATTEAGVDGPKVAPSSSC